MLKKTLFVLFLTALLSCASAIRLVNSQIEPPPTEWSETYGGTQNDEAFSMVQTEKGGYALAGYTESFGSGDKDVWLLKTDQNGDIQWNKTYGATGDDWGYSLIQTGDRGYAMAGITDSFGAGDNDFYLIKTDVHGNMIWNKTYGGPWNDQSRSLIQTSDGGYVVAGSTSYAPGPWTDDVWVVKTDSNGNMIWNKTYGGSSHDSARPIIQTFDGGYAVAGATYSYGNGDADFWLIKTDANGNMQWNKTYGGSGLDAAYSLIQTKDGGYAMAGVTNSFGSGSYDFWLVKTDDDGITEWNRTYGGSMKDEAWPMVQTIEGGYALASYTESFGAGSRDFWLVKTDAHGDMQWNKTYGGTGDDYAYSLVLTGDGGYALAGYTESFGAGGRDFWMIRLAPTIEWEYTFEDPCRDTVLKISTDDKYFQFVASEKEFPMKYDPRMRVVKCQYFTSIAISFEDEEMKLSAYALDSRFDYCIAYTKNMQTGKTYLLIDKPGIE